MFADERKAFFFEKKKQKTFIGCRGTIPGSGLNTKSFLVLFFKKEHFFLILPLAVSLPENAIDKTNGPIRTG
jgi:hypothetical protein